MSEKKHIDRLFQEKFKDFEAKPNANVWAGIQDKLDKPQKETKTPAPIWWRYAGVAAALLLLLTVGGFIINNNILNTEGDTIIVDNDENSSNELNTKNSEAVTDSNTSNKNYNNKSNLETENNIESSENKEQINIINNKLFNDGVANSDENKALQNTNGASKALQNNTLKTKDKSLNTEENNSDTNINYASNNNNYKTENKTAVVAQNNNVNNSATNPENKSTFSQDNTENASNTVANNTVKENATNPDLDKSATQNTIEKNFSTTDAVAEITNSEKEKENVNKMEPDSANSSNTIEEALAKIEDLDEKEENVNRWSVSANAAPVYYNTLGKGSHIHEQFIDNPKNGEVNTSYGVNVGFNLSDKLKVRSGVNKLNLSYDTANVIVYEDVSTTPSSSPLKTIDFNDAQLERISVLSSNNLAIQHVSELVNDMLNAALSQRLSYFEVPMELQYAVVNKRFGLHVIGGVSTFILSDNDVVTEIENRDTKIGEANNVNNVSFSANAGIGIDYKFSDKLQFNLEPTFKYQLNAYSETSGDFRPYIIGVYTGFSYKF